MYDELGPWISADDVGDCGVGVNDGVDDVCDDVDHSVGCLNVCFLNSLPIDCGKPVIEVRLEVDVGPQLGAADCLDRGVVGEVVAEDCSRHHV